MLVCHTYWDIMFQMLFSHFTKLEFFAVQFTKYLFSYHLELRKTRGPDKEFLQKLDSVSYQLSSLDQDLQARVQQPLPHDRTTMDSAHKQQAVSTITSSQIK